MQRVGVGLAVGPHGGGQGQVLGGGLVVAAAGEGEAEAEVGVVVGRGGLDDRAEVGRRGLVLAGVELGAGQRLADAARARLGVGRPLQDLGRGGRAALAEQLHAGGVPGRAPRPDPGRRRRGRRRHRCRWRTIRPMCAARGRRGWRSFPPAGNPSYRLALLTWCEDPLSAWRWSWSRPDSVPWCPLCPGPGRRTRKRHITTVRRDRPRHARAVARGLAVQHRRADPARAGPGRAGGRADRGRRGCATGWTTACSRRTASPALYVYEQRGPGYVQRGLIGLVRVGTTAIHPHEDVMPGPVAGRRELMAAVHGNLEPILLVYNGGTGAGGHGGTAGPVSGFASEAGSEGPSGTAASATSRLVDLTAGGADAARLHGHRRRGDAPDLGADRPGRAGGRRRRPRRADRADRRRPPPVRRLRRAPRVHAGRRPGRRARGTTGSRSWSTRTPTRSGSARSTG